MITKQSALFILILALAACAGDTPAHKTSVQQAQKNKQQILASIPDWRGTSILAGPEWIPNQAMLDALLKQASQLHLNMVGLHVPMHVACDIPNGGGLKPEWDQRLRATMDACQQNGLGVVLEMDKIMSLNQGAPAWFVEYQAIRKGATQIILRYKDHPALRAWGLTNEPLSEAAVHQWDKAVVLEGLRAHANTIRDLDPKTPITVGESYPDLEKEWCDLVDYVSVHIYVPDVKSPIGETEIDHAIERIHYWLDRVHKECPGKPMVLEEWGFSLQDVTPVEQAELYKAVLDLCRKKNIPNFFWALNNEKDRQQTYGVLEEGTLRWLPAAFAIEEHYRKQ